MTLIEIVFVVAIIGTLMAFIIGGITERMKRMDIENTRMIMSKLQMTMQLYRLDTGRLPTASQGLAALTTRPGGVRRWRGPYAKADDITDVWGTTIKLEYDGRDPRFISAGADQSFGSEDDVIHPEPEEAH